MDSDTQRWIERNAAQLGRALADPRVRAEVLALLGGTDDERRLEAARRELEVLEARWPLLEEDEHGP